LWLRITGFRLSVDADTNSWKDPPARADGFPPASVRRRSSTRSVWLMGGFDTVEVRRRNLASTAQTAVVTALIVDRLAHISWSSKSGTSAAKSAPRRLLNATLATQVIHQASTSPLR
jgi:hypothetical protein